MFQNREAELIVLGMALSDSLTAEKVAALPEDTFTYDDSKAVYRGIRRVVEKHGNPDIVTTANACSELGEEPGMAMMEAARLAVTSVNYGQYETILMDLRKRRNLYMACSELTAHIADLSHDPEALAGDVLSVITDSAGTTQSVSVKDAMNNLLAMIDKREYGITTGVAGLDSVTGGFKPGQLIYLGARPGVGKTALGLYMAAHVACRSGPVLVVSLEMDPEQLAARIAAAVTGVDVQSIENCKLTDSEHATIWGQSPIIGKMPMRICTSATTPLQIRREARTMLREKAGLKLIMVDYLQLLRPDKSSGSRYEEITQISRELKLMAMDLRVPILALTQLNRESEAKGGMKKRRPSMAESRDSGAIEQDANVFLTLYAPDEPKMEDPEFEYWDACRRDGAEWQILTVEKNRQGRCGQISLKFDKPHMLFRTLTGEAKTGE